MSKQVPLAMDHRGTASSPILVDDSEDEVHGELCQLTDDSIDASRDLGEQQHRVDQLVMRISDAPVASPHKRKRDENRPDFVQGSSSTPLLPTESKKARKRRRKLERQAQEAEMFSRAQEQQRWCNEMSSVLFDPTGSTGMPLHSGWDPMINVNMNMYTPTMATYPVEDGLPSYHEPDPPSHASIAAAAATSDWVSAMACTGTLPDPIAYANQYQWPPPHFAPRSPSLSPPALLERLSSPTIPHRLIQFPPGQANLPQRPLPFTQLLPIGMKPDTEPHSKHGVFSFGPPNLLFHTPNNSNRRADDKGYIPNPACTIVMEQLPKTHRTIEFVKQWAKKATGTQPVCIVVDPPSAKALVEFSSAKMARKAWESPRLGAEYAGLKTHQLKGKPRADLIRVWWYRVDGVGAGSGVGEIEEGEIEEDGVDKKGQIESKKARKARLAKERIEKFAKRAGGHAQSVAVLSEVPENRDEVESIASSRGASIVQQVLNEVAETMLPVQGQAQDREKTLSQNLSSATAVDIPRDSSLRPGSTKTPLTSIRPQSTSMPTGTTAPPSPSLPLPPPTFAVDSRAPADTVQPAPIPGLALAYETQRPSSADQPSTTAQAASVNLLEMKRTLLAKQRELEGKIGMSKLEMSKLKVGASADAGAGVDIFTPGPSAVGTTAAMSTISSSLKESEDNKATEDRLRKLVLQSQKSKNGRAPDQSQTLSTFAYLSAPVSAISPVLPTPAPSTTGTPTPVSDPVQVHTGGVSNFSLEDLAVSFITETISTLKQPNGGALGSKIPTFGGDMAPPGPPAGQSEPHQTRPSTSRQNHNPIMIVNVKEELAARQKRLEEYIAESKTLMAQLIQARTKQEKDRLLVLMREKSRLMDEEKEKMASADKSATMSTTGITIPANNSNGHERCPSPTEQKQVAIFKIRWPTESQDGGIMIISDDDDDDE
ncbi:hypothetical protein AX15_000426 [Amanita polypyramis BW_CC]|nr:hypothetical protein AX15_000426 [Amanita polypyramis BW_CC]